MCSGWEPTNYCLTPLSCLMNIIQGNKLQSQKKLQRLSTHSPPQLLPANGNTVPEAPREIVQYLIEGEEIAIRWCCRR